MPYLKTLVHFAQFHGVFVFLFVMFFQFYLQVLQQDAELKALKTKMAAIEEIIKQAAEASQGGKRAVEQVGGKRDCFPLVVWRRLSSAACECVWVWVSHLCFVSLFFCFLFCVFCNNQMNFERMASKLAQASSAGA